MNEYYYFMLYNLVLVKQCYDYDSKSTMRVFGKMEIYDEHTEYFITDCFRVVSNNIRFYLNKHKKNPITGDNHVTAMVFKHPIIENAYDLYAKVKQLKNKKYAAELKKYVDEAERHAHNFDCCFEECTLEFRKNKRGIINRFYFENLGYCIDYEGSLYSLMSFVSSLQHGYLTVSNMLFDEGVDIQ